MSITHFFTSDIVIQRLRSTSGNKKAFQTTATIAGHIQELNAEARQMLGIIEEKGWEAWFPVDTDLKENDIVVDEHGMVYKVRETVKKDYGVNQHLQVILMEQNE